NHAEVTAVEGCEVTLQDAFGGPVRRVRSRALVNAAGPWVDVVRARARALSGARLHLTKGIHLVVRRDRLPVQHIVVMQARDRRSVFAVPHGDFTYLGTTDTDYGAPTAYPEVTSEDAAYLFEAAERTFAAPALTSADVVATWAGLRPRLSPAPRASSAPRSRRRSTRRWRSRWRTCSTAGPGSSSSTPVRDSKPSRRWRRSPPPGSAGTAPEPRPRSTATATSQRASGASHDRDRRYSSPRAGPRP